jgi:hypothetical protein
MTTYTQNDNRSPIREVLPDNLYDLRHVIDWQREQLRDKDSQIAALQSANAELRDVLDDRVEKALEEKGIAR